MGTVTVVAPFVISVQYHANSPPTRHHFKGAYADGEEDHTVKRDVTANLDNKPEALPKDLNLKWVVVRYSIQRNAKKFVGLVLKTEDNEVTINFLKKDDSWINISPEQLEALLTEKRGGLAGKEDDSDQQGQEEKIGKAITESLKEFLQHTSGLEGVEAPKPPPRRKKKTSNNKVDFDASHFSDTIHSILDFKEPDSSEGSSSGMSDYSGEDSDIDLTEESKTNEASYGKDKENLVKEMKEYMEMMDQELAQTNVGLSFERKMPSHPTTSSQQVDQKQDESKNQTMSAEEDDLEVQPIDVDLTVLKNILESYNSQQGMPGPASSILSSMGLQLPENTDST
ncbi:protein ecdysoneless homolog [Limulus polyphemus]|uniref:Protein ecdysoneless homolog n=1 Tax=Limulus polyphemus TaxID=6850 RepID=A0ABM1BK80_LIMPO|nr:protein ecdysoneless homolog [Limulus polyphemus]